MKHKLFVYGTLKDPEIQESIIGRHLSGRKAHLDGWGLYLAENGYLFIKPTENTIVQGVIISLDDEMLKKTDRWEGTAYLYEREKVTAVLDNGKKEVVWVYSRRHVNGDLFGDPETPLSD